MLFIVLSVVLSLSTASAVADAAPKRDPRHDPPNMMAIPKEVPEAINGVIPPAPYPRVNPIPQQAQAPGYSKATLQLRNAVLPDPIGDPMFDHWPRDLAKKKPGQVIAVKDVTFPTGFLVTAPITRARLVKFRSTDALDQPIFGTATVIEPRQKWTGKGSRPILINNLPINSLGLECTVGNLYSKGPSLAAGGLSPTDYIPPTTQLALARGYTVIVPDHLGPRMAYAEPKVAGQIILDSVRAAGHLSKKLFGDSRVAMTGYSGGAIATRGAAKMVGSYAPELQNRMVGAALGGVPADYRMLVGSMNANIATGLFHIATFGIAREHPEMLTMMNNLAEWVATSPLKNSCTTVGAAGGITMFPMQLAADDPDPFRSPVAEKIYAITEMADTKSPVPLYIYNGGQEWWIPAAGARNLYRQQCKLGANAAYREVFGEHLIGAVTGYPEALTWLDARLRGKPAKSECPKP